GRLAGFFGKEPLDQTVDQPLHGLTARGGRGLQPVTGGLRQTHRQEGGRGLAGHFGTLARRAHVHIARLLPAATSAPLSYIPGLGPREGRAAGVCSGCRWIACRLSRSGAVICCSTGCMTASA